MIPFLDLGKINNRFRSEIDARFTCILDNGWYLQGEENELLIIDDGSKDGTFAKMQELKPECEKRFVRVVMETQENQGSCVTLNRLLDKTDGKYIYSLASDDMAKPQAIEVLHQFLSENSDYVFSCWRRRDNKC